MRGGNDHLRSQSWNPERYAKNAAFVPEFGRPVVELLALRPGERILDLGCGDGVLTQRLAAAGASVVGVDASPEQVAAARQLGLDARVMDGAELEFDLLPPETHATRLARRKDFHTRRALLRKRKIEAVRLARLRSRAR